MSDITAPPFDMSRAEDRAALTAALLGLGIPAILHPSIPWPFVCVPLDTHLAGEAFDIEVFERDYLTLVGVSGYRPNPDPDAEGDPIDAYSLDYYGAETLGESTLGESTLGNTVAQVETLWGAREQLVAAFHAGHFDCGGLMAEVLTGNKPSPRCPARPHGPAG